MFDHFVELALKVLVEVHCGNNDHFNTEHGMVKSKRQKKIYHEIFFLIKRH